MQIKLANPRGFCAGVDRAIEIVNRALEVFGPPIYVRHEVVHNKFVVEDLRNRGVLFEPLKNRVLGMIFEKASTRTRLSFEAGMIQLGGQAIFLSPRDTQLGRGEPIGDTAIVMSSMLDAVMIRTFAHSNLTEFAAHSTVPVINGLSDDLHPCQLLADLQTFQEHRGTLAGRTFAWIGDGNNGDGDRDVLIFRAGDDADTVHGFETGRDVLDLGGRSYSATEVRDGTLLNFGGGDSVLLHDVFDFI